MNDADQAHLVVFMWTVFIAFYTVENVSARQMPVFIEKIQLFRNGREKDCNYV